MQRPFDCRPIMCGDFLSDNLDDYFAEQRHAEREKEQRPKTARRLAPTQRLIVLTPTSSRGFSQIVTHGRSPSMTFRSGPRSSRAHSAGSSVPYCLIAGESL